MNKKNQRTLEAIFKQPVQSNVVWKDIESLMRHFNTEITEGEGSRVRFALNGTRATFQGTTVDEIEQAFKDSVDDYLAFCKERGEEPDRPFSGKFNLRIPPDLHAKLSIAAQLQGESLNNYITKMLQRFVA